MQDNKSNQLSQNKKTGHNLTQEDRSKGGKNSGGTANLKNQSEKR